jgi:creatinine amidohydrolase
VTYVDLRSITSAEASALPAGAIGVVQVGALEQHGPHLPLCTDDLITEALVQGVAERVAVPLVVAPLIAVGLSDHHAAFPGTVTVRRSVFDGLLEAHVAGFERMGVRRVALLSAHGGNFRALGELAERLGGADLEVRAYADFGRFLEVMATAGREAGLDAPATDSHAGAYETSMVLAIAGAGAVRPYDAVEGYTAGEEGWLERLQRDGVGALSEIGVVGRPAGASADAGRRELDALSDEIARWLVAAFAVREAEGARAR